MALLVRTAFAALAMAAVGTAAITAVSAQSQNNEKAQQSAGESEKKAGKGEEANPSLARADKDMRAVLETLKELGAKPLHTLTVEEARKGPTPGDAAKAVMSKNGKKQPEPNVRKENVQYTAAAGEQPARIYIPTPATGKQAQSDQPMPVILYFHGGGWVIADLDTYDASAQALAQKTNAIVVSAEYRHAPENKFPAAHDDAFAAYRWVLENAQKWGGDPQRVAVAGESAGGNLAINVAIAARDNNVQAPVHMLLVYPVAGTDTNTESYKENAEAMPLGKADMEWFIDKVLADKSQMNDPRLDIVGRAKLENLPPATVITAQIDPLRSEGRALAAKLREAGSEVTTQNYEGATHEFFGMAGVVRDAEQAQALAVRELREAFNQSAATGAGSGTAGKSEKGEPKGKK